MIFFMLDFNFKLIHLLLIFHWLRFCYNFSDENTGRHRVYELEIRFSKFHIYKSNNKLVQNYFTRYAVSDWCSFNEYFWKFFSEFIQWNMDTLLYRAFSTKFWLFLGKSIQCNSIKNSRNTHWIPVWALYCRTSNMKVSPINLNVNTLENSKTNGFSEVI